MPEDLPRSTALSQDMGLSPVASAGVIAPAGEDTKESLKPLHNDLAAATPPSSTGSSAVQSPELHPIRSNSSIPALSSPGINGASSPAAAAGAVPGKKPGTFRTLTRMFSNSSKKDDIRDPAKDKIYTEIPETHFVEKIGAVPPPPPTPAQAQNGATDPLSRRSTAASIVPRMDQKDKAADPKTRFEVFDDGLHEHHLKSAKRQEKLRTMLKDLLVGKKKEEIVATNQDPQALSLMSSWVDQLKQEKEKMAHDKKDKVTSTATMVEKYGKCQEVIGRGAFGVVRISHKQDPAGGKQELLYAVKEFRRRPQESAKKYQKRLMSEFCISSTLRHPNVIHTLDLMENADGEYCEVMEFCAGGDLYSLVLAAGKLKVGEADCFFKQLMRGVEYIHEMGVAHRDLKPENLLLTPNGGLKITDFGNGECFRTQWESEAHMTVGLCGSAPYIAPEEYVEREFDPRAVDVWACGVIYMAMRTGRHLWRVAKKDEDEFYERYLEGRRDEDGYQPIESLHRARCRNVIYSILDPNPSRRITASQVLRSEWGKEIKVCKAGEEGF